MRAPLSDTAHPLNELLDLPRLQLMLEQLHLISGFTNAIVSAEGEILAGAGWQPLCVRFHRSHPVCGQRCRESDTQLSAQAQNLAKLGLGDQSFQFAAYKCANGLWDMAIPIVIDNRHLGNFFIGQFFYAEEEVDWEFFTQQAREMGFPEQEYLAAVQAMPRFTTEQVEAMLKFNQGLVTYLTQLGNQQATQLQLLQRLNQSKAALLDQDRQLTQSLPILEQTETMEQVVHDLKTPLNGIYGMAQLIRMSLDIPQRDEVDRFLGQILDSTRSMVNQIDDLLALSEAESSQPHRNYPLPLAPLLARLDTAFGQLAELRAIELRFAPTPGLQVQGHERIAYNVLANLLSNALKYSPDHTQVQVVAEVQGPQVLIHVDDQGLGIPPGEESQLFQKFASLSNRPLAMESSTGIGLYTAKRLAAKLGGSLTYQPRQPQGSRFTLTLPLAELA